MATSISSGGAWPHAATPQTALARPVPGEALGTRSGRQHDADAQAFARALSLFEAGEWGAAFAGLRPLADRGHPQAARLALLLARRGPVLFGGRYAATAHQRRHWAAHSD